MPPGGGLGVRPPGNTASEVCARFPRIYLAHLVRAATEGVEPCAAYEGGAHGPALTLRRATAASFYNAT